MTTFKDNPQYQLAYEGCKHELYVPISENDYHLSRYVAANAQNIYSASGATKELLSSFMDEIIKRCNDEKDIKTLRTDIGVLCNNIKYRLKYPVDEDCALRMGAIYCFMEGEDPNEVSDMWTRKKVELARNDDALYSFFLTEGIKRTPSWIGLDNPLTNTDYSTKREQDLSALLPQ